MITVRRNSSMELLRIILMIFIIIHHIIYQVVTPNFDNRMYACVDVFLHTAVIIFVLITGYFGLRFSWHKAMLLLFQVLFYSILLGSIAHLYFGIQYLFFLDHYRLKVVLSIIWQLLLCLYILYTSILLCVKLYM